MRNEEERISEFIGSSIEITSLNNRENRIKKYINTASGACGTITKISNVYVIRVPDKEKKELKKMFKEIMVENTPNLAEDINLLKSKDKERILKAAREKWHITHKEKEIWMTANFSSEIIEITRNGTIFFNAERKELLTHNCISRENRLRNEGEVKTFSDKGKLR